jgi:hypothetical protein
MGHWAQQILVGWTGMIDENLYCSSKQKEEDIAKT